MRQIAWSLPPIDVRRAHAVWVHLDVMGWQTAPPARQAIQHEVGGTDGHGRPRCAATITHASRPTVISRPAHGQIKAAIMLSTMVAGR
jgi:hypothetical protein